MSRRKKRFGNRSNRCICGNNKSINNCCANLKRNFIEQANEVKNGDDLLLKTYIIYHDLWPTATINLGELIELVGSYSKFELLQSLSRLNLMFNLYDKKDDPLWFFRYFDLPDWYQKKVIGWINSGARGYAIHRQGILFLQLLTLLAPDKGKLDLEGRTVELFDMLMMSNSFLDQRNYDETDRILGVKAALFSNSRMMTTDDLMDSIGRYYSIYNNYEEVVKIRPQVIDLNKEFVKAYGISVTDIQSLCVGIWAKYESGTTDEKFFFDPKNFLIGSSFFTKVRQPEVLDKIFSLFSNTIQEHSDAAHQIVRNNIPSALPLNFLQFYNRPLVNTEHDTFYPLDITMLFQKITDGLYWILHDYYSQQNMVNERRALFGSIGLSAEYYVLEMIRYSLFTNFLIAYRYRLLCEMEKEIEGCDFIIMDKKTVLLIEFATQNIPIGDAISANYEIIKNQIKRLLIDGMQAKQRGKGKAAQLQSYYEKVKQDNCITNKINGDVIVLDDSIKVIPIVVTLSNLPQHNRLRNWYAEIMREGGLDENFVQNVELFSLNDFEKFMGAVMSGSEPGSLMEQFRGSELYGHSFYNWLVHTDIKFENLFTRKMADKLFDTAKDYLLPK